MSERSKSTRLVVHLLLVVLVLGVGFGGGALFGWGTRKRSPKLPESTESIPDAEVPSALATCKRELKALKKALKKARAKPPVMVVPDDAGLEIAAKVQALQKEVHECKVRETLQNAYVCGTMRDHVSLYDVLVHGNSCTDPPGIGEYILNSVDKCAEFAGAYGYPAHLDEDNLTQTERDRIIMSNWRGKVTKENEARALQWLRRECRRIWALPEE
jgi:hypothetical protein